MVDRGVVLSFSIETLIELFFFPLLLLLLFLPVCWSPFLVLELLLSRQIMEGGGNRWTNVQGDPVEVSSVEWRSQLHPEARQRIVNKIVDTLKRYLPINGAEGISEVNRVAVQFEEKIYTGATSQSDYLRKISMKMLTMEQKAQRGGTANPIASGSISESR